MHKTIGDGIGGRKLDPTFREPVDRHDYRVGVTQVLTRNLLASLNFETISEQGYLQNPYRFIALPARMLRHSPPAAAHRRSSPTRAPATRPR